jgi:hypothetical protein
MIITDIRTQQSAERATLSAHVRWEDCDREPLDVYFETERRFADALACSTHPFLTASVLPAMDSGEQRIRVDGAVCPQLRQGLTTVVSTIRHWYTSTRPAPTIEMTSRSTVAPRAMPGRAACFLTGGVDSLATLRANHLTFDATHPAAIKDAVIVFGLEVEDRKAFDHVLTSLSAISQDAGITLIPVSTNVRSLNGDWEFWHSQFMGAALAAVAHGLGRRFSLVSIASDYDIPNLRPHGSHPLMEPNFSSYETRIQYDGITMSRLEKTRLLADWDVALRNLRVCNKTEHYNAIRLNCGKCEKCLRTMLALLVLGVLDRTNAFPDQDVTPQALSQIYLNDKAAPFYRELIVPLEEIGRADLARCLERMLAPHGISQRLRARVADFDRRHLHRVLWRLVRLTNRVAAAAFVLT